MEELNIDKYSVLEVRKLFTKHSGINCLNEFTVQDIEDSKKRIFMKLHQNHDKELLKDFLDRASEKIISDKFLGGIKETQGVVVKNTVRDNLNADYKNTIHRLILIDSQYRPDLLKESSDFICTLNEKVVNAVSLEIINISIPYTFYNIENRRGNNRFTINNVPFIIPDGNYDLAGIIKYIDDNTALTITKSEQGIVSISSTPEITIDFMPEGTKINSCLGWYLGFRKLTGETVLSADSSVSLIYTFTGTISGNAVAMTPRIKYFLVVVDDFNNNQTADTLIQTQLDPLNPSPTSYFTQDPFLDQLTPSNVSTYLKEFPNRTLTKAQIYTRAQQNQVKNTISLQNLRLEVNTPNQILAVFPFDSSKLSLGETYFTDKSDYKREYHSPTNIEKLQVKIYDDNGFLINFNGNNWYMTLMTENLYKY